jgi:hypothetical protein
MGPLLNFNGEADIPNNGRCRKQGTHWQHVCGIIQGQRAGLSIRWPTTSYTRSSALKNLRHLQRETEFINKALTPAVAQLVGGITITPDNFIAEGDFVATQGRGNACTKSGGTYNNTYCHAFRIANRK